MTSAACRSFVQRNNDGVSDCMITGCPAGLPPRFQCLPNPQSRVGDWSVHPDIVRVSGIGLACQRSGRGTFDTSARVERSTADLTSGAEGWEEYFERRVAADGRKNFRNMRPSRTGEVKWATNCPTPFTAPERASFREIRGKPFFAPARCRCRSHSTS